MALTVLGGLVLLLVGLGAGLRRRRRAATLARVRGGWGHPVDRARRMDAVAAAHRSRVSNLGSPGSLDDRTWQDLDLDDVFVALDRTGSTLGQHALYHRLRTAPVADSLEEFERLVCRLGGDAAVRERAQMALAPLQDSHGYDLWWLAGKDAVESRRGTSCSPCCRPAHSGGPQRLRSCNDGSDLPKRSRKRADLKVSEVANEEVDRDGSQQRGECRRSERREALFSGETFDTH